MNTEKNHGLVTTTNQAQPTPFQRFGTHLKNGVIATAVTGVIVATSAHADTGGVDVTAAVASITALVANVVAIGGAILTVYIAIKGFKMVQKAL